MSADHYETLGVAASADQQTLRAAYLRQMRAAHPDLAADDPRAHDAARRLNVAYEVLSDPEERRRYDALRLARHGPVGWRREPQAMGATAHERRVAAAARAAYSDHGVDFRRDFHRTCLRFGVAVLLVGVVVLFTLGV